MHLKVGSKICQAMIFRGNFILLAVHPDWASTAFVGKKQRKKDGNNQGSLISWLTPNGNMGTTCLQIIAFFFDP